MASDEQIAHFRALMDDFLTGDQAAAERLCREFETFILRVVRRRLARAQRVQVDSFDIVQDVWASFFTQPPADRQFDRPRALANYLCRMAVHKVNENARRRATQMHGGCEEPFSDDPAQAPLAATPSPSAIIGAEDQWQHMLEGRPRAHQRILQMLRQGLSHTEIAARLRTDTKTIRRLLRRIQLASDS